MIVSNKTTSDISQQPERYVCCFKTNRCWVHRKWQPQTA